MTTYLWIVAFVCWGVAALLILSLAYPSLAQLTHRMRKIPQQGAFPF